MDKTFVINGILEVEGEFLQINNSTIYFDPIAVSVDGFDNLRDLINSTTNLPILPQFGWIEQNVMYSYEGSVLICRQGHDRTIYDPFETPALFSVYRVDNGELEWIENESVIIGDIRFYNGIEYECIQAHMTLSSWTPPSTPALWSVVASTDYSNAPQWVSTNWAQYTMGFFVKDSGKIWKVIGLSHTWIQPALTGNGAISWEYVTNI